VRSSNSLRSGWLPLDEGLPLVRVIVARHAAPPPGKSVKVGKRIDEWVIRPLPH
jgi:hypothetical protein